MLFGPVSISSRYRDMSQRAAEGVPDAESLSQRDLAELVDAHDTIAATARGRGVDGAPRASSALDALIASHRARRQGHPRAAAPVSAAERQAAWIQRRPGVRRRARRPDDGRPRAIVAPAMLVATSVATPASSRPLFAPAHRTVHLRSGDQHDLRDHSSRQSYEAIVRIYSARLTLRSKASVARQPIARVTDDRHVSRRFAIGDVAIARCARIRRRQAPPAELAGVHRARWLAAPIAKTSDHWRNS